MLTSLQQSYSDAGNWLFCGRKWIDPADPDGRAKLDLHYHNLSILFPAFTSACSLDRLVDAVAAVIDSWSRHDGARSSPVDISPSPPSPTDSASPPEVRHCGAAPPSAGPDRGFEDSDRGGWPGPGVGPDDDAESCQWPWSLASAASAT